MTTTRPLIGAQITITTIGVPLLPPIIAIVGATLMEGVAAEEEVEVVAVGVVIVEKTDTLPENVPKEEAVDEAEVVGVEAEVVSIAKKRDTSLESALKRAATEEEVVEVEGSSLLLLFLSFLTNDEKKC